MKNNILIGLLMLISIVILNGCAKDGATGPAGKDGNANVKSQTITITESQWNHTGTVGEPGDGYEAIQTSSIITSDIVSKGAVMAYLSVDNLEWGSLPFTVPTGVSSTEPYSESWLISYKTNQITARQ